MILVWPRTRHICCMQEGFAEWTVASERHYRQTTGGRDMGADIARAATMGYLQCDIELELMVMAETNLLTSFFHVFARPGLMRAIVTLQLRHRYRMWLAMRSRRLAVAMALHPRLGGASALRVLDTELLMACSI
jgi:hypothetical protein